MNFGNKMTHNATNKNHTVIIYLTGKPGVGKYTISQELGKHGYVVCDNQLINIPIFQLANYDGFGKIPDFAWDAVARIRAAVFDFMIMEKHNSYAMTNNLYDNEGDRRLYEHVKDMAAKRGSIFVPVSLVVSEEEHLQRISRPERRHRWKSINPDDVYDQTPLLAIDHPNLFELDVTIIPPQDAVSSILSHVQNCKDKR